MLFRNSWQVGRVGGAAGWGRPGEMVLAVPPGRYSRDYIGARSSLGSWSSSTG